MTGTYAAQTEVSTDRSFAEIKRTLQRFGATGFGYAEQGDTVIVLFEINGLRVRMTMSLPDPRAFRLNNSGRERPATAIERDYEQACRQRWRTLANGIKAKLALVDDGISSIEHEFLADIVLPDDSTVGDRWSVEAAAIARTGELPPLLPGVPPPAKLVALGAGTP